MLRTLLLLRLLGKSGSSKTHQLLPLLLMGPSADRSSSLLLYLLLQKPSPPVPVTSPAADHTPNAKAKMKAEPKYDGPVMAK
ncbi:hypothetical protein [Neolewinella xylanilytica]|nr:hypothetical protein [Neolewinella xylanilytica]